MANQNIPAIAAAHGSPTGKALRERMAFSEQTVTELVEYLKKSKPNVYAELVDRVQDAVAAQILDQMAAAIPHFPMHMLASLPPVQFAQVIANFGRAFRDTRKEVPPAPPAFEATLVIDVSSKVTTINEWNSNPPPLGAKTPVIDVTPEEHGRNR